MSASVLSAVKRMLCGLSCRSASRPCGREGDGVDEVSASLLPASPAASSLKMASAVSRMRAPRLAALSGVYTSGISFRCRAT